MTGNAARTRQRRGSATDAALVGRQIGAEQRMFWRNPASAGFTFVFPLLFLVIFTSLNTGNTVDFGAGSTSYAAYYLPGIIGFSIVSACFTNLALSVTAKRESGILKRKRGTPLPVWALMGGIVGSEVVVALVLTVITTAISTVGYGVDPPRHPLAMLGVLLLGAGCFCSLGLAMTVPIPNEDAAPAMVNFVTFPLLFLSGTFFPIGNDTLRQISDVLPIARLQSAMFDSVAPPVKAGGVVVHAAGPDSGDLLVLAVWLVVGVVLVLRRFRWEPRQGF